VKAKQKRKAATAARSVRKTAKRQAKPLASSARLEAAHANFIGTRQGTPEYTQAWEVLLETLVEK
jgi:hypothetical protein